MYIICRFIVLVCTNYQVLVNKAVREMNTSIVSQCMRGASPRGIKQPPRTRYQLLFLRRCRQPKYVAAPRRRRSWTNNVRGMCAIPMRAASSRIQPAAWSQQQAAWMQPRLNSGGGRDSGLLLGYSIILRTPKAKPLLDHLRWKFRHVQIWHYIFRPRVYRNVALRENAKFSTTMK